MAADLMAEGSSGPRGSPRPADPEQWAQRVVDAAGAADAAADPILAVDETGAVVYANAAAHELLDHARLESASLDSLLIVDDDQSPSSLLTPDPQRVLADILSGTGEQFEAQVSIAPADAEHPPRWVLVMHPLPRQELSIRELLRRATHDELTTLANRSYLLERVNATFLDPRTADVPHALVMMDLDRFKDINDSWGHDAGDAVLIEVARRLAGLCRPGDMVARLGGDEFAAWCRIVNTNVPGLAARLAGVFANPVLFGDLDLTVSGSVGTTTTSFAQDPNELLRQADAAMYRAKASGPGRQVIFDAHMAAELRERGTRERELREGLASDQFELHYQPVVELATRHVIGVEALARWKHPRLGELQPAEFLPLVESTLLGNDFDTAMLERACRQLAEWRKELSQPLSMWINVSPKHLSTDLVERLSELVDELELDSSQLVIELTEDSSVATPERAEMLEGLRSIGVRIAVDDFGTGYSQLSYLPELPLDLVKLDRSFVQGISREPGRHSLASSVISLAHALDAKVVAEGVETSEDLEVLEQLGCDFAQGFLLARPRPAGDVPGVDLREVLDLR